MIFNRMAASALIETYQVTEWASPSSWIQSQWGKIHYERWLQREIDRWFEKDLREAWVEIKQRTDKDGDKDDVAMFTKFENLILFPEQY